MLDDAREQFQSGRRRKAGRDNAGGLLRKRLGQRLVTVADARHPDAGHPVEKAIAVDIFDERAVTASHGNPRQRRYLLNPRRQIVLFCQKQGLRLRPWNTRPYTHRHGRFAVRRSVFAVARRREDSVIARRVLVDFFLRQALV